MTTNLPETSIECAKTNYGIYSDDLKKPLAALDTSIYLNIPFETIGYCACSDHPANFIGDKGALSWADCYDECLKDPTCLIFNSNNATSCNLYTADCTCNDNPGQIKYKINRKYVKDEGETGMILFDTTTAADPKSVYLNVETFGLIKSGIFIDYTI